MSIEDRIATIADEAFGPFQMQSVDENLSAIERGIASDQADRERLRAALEMARDLIIKHHDCSKQVQLGCLCPHCSREDGSSPELDQIWDALRTSNPSHHAEPRLGGDSVDGVVGHLNKIRGGRKMERKYDNPMHRLVDRGEWKHAWHMKARFGHVDWYDKDNLAVVEREIYAARETAALLERLADEAEESMRAHMPNPSRQTSAARKEP